MFTNFRKTINNLAAQLKPRHVGSSQQARSNQPQEAEGETHQELKPLEEELKTIISQLEGFAGKNPTPGQLRPIRQRLGYMDSLYFEGRFNLPGVQGIPPGQARVADQLSTAHELLRARLEESDYYKVSNELRPYHDKLENIQHALDALKDKADIHPSDLRSYRQKLSEIDAHYHQAGFEVQGRLPEGQAIVAEQLNKAEETVRELLMKTDYYRVDPALYSLHDRLDSIIMGLEGLQHKSSLMEKEVSKYRKRLEYVDRHYTEGKFVVDGKVPEGQAIVVGQLDRAHALFQELQDKIKEETA